MDHSPLVTIVSLVWGDYDRFIPDWLAHLDRLPGNPNAIIVHGPDIDPGKYRKPNVTWVAADPFDTGETGFRLCDQVYPLVTEGWIWPLAIDDYGTHEGMQLLLDAPADAEFMTITATYLDGSGRWDSDLNQILGPMSGYRMVDGCPFTAALYKRAGPVSNPPEWQGTFGWGWYLRVMAAGANVFNGTGPVSVLCTKDTGWGRRATDTSNQERLAHEYARHLGLM